tara:strand:- start:541 stop:1005 length:465 start_codon:yes stop_codon:yes gene_type:complete
MANKDLANNLKMTQVLDPATTSATVNTTGLDLNGANGAMINVLIGESGDTLSGSVYWDLILQDSADNSSWSAVTSNTDVSFADVDSSGIYATIDAASEDDASYPIGYNGAKRYVRVAITKTGTHTNGTPIGAVGISMPIHMPTASSDNGTATGA